MDTAEATVLSTQEGKEKYDAVLKQLLANRQILARILKRFVPEFKHYSVKQIEKKYILPETITISKIGVQKNMTNLVESTGTEDKSNNEGNVTYDIMFRVGYPGKSRKMIGMYINLEIQNSYYPGYPIESRAIYYASRRLSSELEKIDNHTNYGGLQKVYSIWLCMGDNVPDEKAGTANLLELVNRAIIGNEKIPKEHYDLISAIIIRINDDMKSDDSTMRLLQSLCSKCIDKQQKLDVMRKSGISTNAAVEGGIEAMCNLSESIFRDGVVKGERNGINIGTKKTNIKTVCNICSSGENITAMLKVVNIEQSFADTVIQAANGDFSTDDTNIDRIYEAMYNPTDTQNE